MLLRTDLWEDDGELRIEVELPGVEPEDIELSISADRLSLRGRLAPPRAEAATTRREHRCERRRGEFAREIPFPVEVLHDTADASLRDGLLCVRIVIRRQASPPKRVPVNPVKTRRTAPIPSGCVPEKTGARPGRVIALRACAALGEGFSV